MTKKTDNSQKKSGKNVWKEVGPFLNMGYQLIITVGIGVFIGWWIDDKYGTEPLYLVIFSIVFSIVALYNFIKTTIGPAKKNKK